MHASIFTSAQAAASSCGQNRVIAVSSVHSGRYPVPRCSARAQGRRIPHRAEQLSLVTRILTKMAIRLWAAALAFVMIGAPVVTTICETTCAARSADATHGEHHSCHAAAPSNEPGISGLAHACGHSDGNEQIGCDQATRVAPPSPLVLEHVTFTLPTLEASVRVVDGRTQHSPPGLLALARQLRI